MSEQRILRLLKYCEWNGQLNQYIGSLKLFYLFQILQVPLHHAAEYGHLACLEALLRQGADVNSKTAEGWTAMHSAALYGRTSCVEALIRYLFARPLTGVLTFVIVTISPIVNCR